MAQSSSNIIPDAPPVPVNGSSSPVKSGGPAKVGPPPLPPPLPPRGRAPNAPPSAAAAPAPSADPPAAPVASHAPVAKHAPQQLAPSSPVPTAKPAAPPQKRAKQQPIVEADEEYEDLPDRTRWTIRGLMNNAAGFMISMLAHTSFLLLLGTIILPGMQAPTVVPQLMHVEPRDSEELTTELDNNLEPSDTIEATGSMVGTANSALASGGSGVGNASGTGAGIPSGFGSGSPSLSAAVNDAVEGLGKVHLEGPPIQVPRSGKLIEHVPAGTLGDSRAIVDNYKAAMDRITQEILLMLSKQKVLLVWVMDQSESMKDDQKEIRDRIEKVYAELGLTDVAQGDALLTAVTSFGEGFAVHTKKPTHDIHDIRMAIDAVPNDPSGKENTCQAVGMTIQMFKSVASRGNRKMALVLVTDESGERDNNDQYLEATIAEAKSANCTVYVLGREAVFGYPYAHIHWVHPQTGTGHWIPIDRGPETAFVEQLQTDGFRRRYDAHSSGFGPYEQSRLAQQTGGVFFMLPSIESNIIYDEKRKFELEAMTAYKPDLRSKVEVVFDRDASVLRTGLTKVVYDLNPYNPKTAEIIEMRLHFSPTFPEFKKQVEQELTKAKMYIMYMDTAQKAIESLQKVRNAEYSPRWQANCDLMHAQLLAYKVRIYEYGAFLQEFVRNPPIVPYKKPPNLSLVYWAVQTRAKTTTGKLTEPFIKQANEMFAEVIKNHPGTPWASRAEIELGRGFGVELIPVYDSPHVPRAISGPIIPVPKM